VFDSVLIANRGEIARRVERTARRLGVRTIAVYSDVDKNLPFVHEADEAIQLGDSSPGASYNNIERILDAARKTGAAAIHPGYGFLSEDARFARAAQEAGFLWIGPSPESMDLMGDKIRARNIMADAGVPVAPGSQTPVQHIKSAVRWAKIIGYPLMIKVAAGGGGLGMGVVHNDNQLEKRFDAAHLFAERFYGKGGVLLEQFLPNARHIEVQILGLGDGRIITVGDRECSVQRRNQKLAEECPAPSITNALRRRLLAAAVCVGETVCYRNAGTVEYLVIGDGDDATFVFLEMNTRLQVEHPVTEAVYGMDLVEQQFRIAADEPLTFDPHCLEADGHSIQLRVNAEDPQNFLPGPGRIDTWEEPVRDWIRVDSGYCRGTAVTPFYDSLMAKLIVDAPSRQVMLARAREAVSSFNIAGPKSNLSFFIELLENPQFVSGTYDTGIVHRMRPGLVQ
jgi:acetyl-CoA carboxylase biotin carboxylase subunit